MGARMKYRSDFCIRAGLGVALAAELLAGGPTALAQPKPPTEKPYQVEWVYRVRYGYQAEWWGIFQKYQIAILDREQQLSATSPTRSFLQPAHPF